ncbi:hypothetical protein [Amycolatopsis taiwanensis]|uniref:DUF2269 domain-containing protein n=1 Tax=Amycolatopsis taiwanensis TaxID=342230 RepID=A0A9W6R7T4_9PSEU|nr:hypothetical protein [Amycolatopsis taiwanensis]GLY69025.1 hypothetical protein Atai01_56440 [Amycolatopsis taiwanensis]
MSIAALIAWIIAAGGGFVLLGTWIAKGGIRTPRTSHFPPAAIFGHFALAAAGLVVWIIYLIADSSMLAWIALGLLVLVALLGFTMFVRWIPSYQARRTVTAAADAGGPGAATAAETPPAEQHFPVVVIGAHGLLAVATVVLVLLSALGVGGS